MNRKTLTTFSLDKTNICKGLAVLFLIFHHVFYIRYFRENVTYRPVLGLSEDQFTNFQLFAKICVPMFLILSGYGMQYSVKQKGSNPIGYAWERFKKLFCNVLSVYSILILFILLCYDNILAFYSKETIPLLAWVLDFTGFASMLGTPNLIGAWWYLGITYFLIFLFPVFSRLISGKETGLATLLFAAGITILSRDATFTVRFDAPTWIFPFVLGMYIAQLDLVNKCLSRLNRVWKQEVVGILLLPVWCLTYKLVMMEILPLGLTLTISATVILLAAILILPGIPGINKAFSSLGALSMTIFLTHTLIWHKKIIQKFIFKLPYIPLNFLTAFILILFFAILIDWLRNKADIVGYVKEKRASV